MTMTQDGDKAVIDIHINDIPVFMAVKAFAERLRDSDCDRVALANCMERYAEHVREEIGCQ